MARPVAKKLKSLLSRANKQNRRAASYSVAGGSTKMTKKELQALRKRDGLIAQYMPYAASIASRVYKSISNVVEYDEVVCSARV